MQDTEEKLRKEIAERRHTWRTYAAAFIAGYATNADSINTSVLPDSSVMSPMDILCDSAAFTANEMVQREVEFIEQLGRKGIRAD